MNFTRMLWILLFNLFLVLSTQAESFSINEEANVLRLQSAKLQLTIQKEPFGFRIDTSPAASIFQTVSNNSDTLYSQSGTLNIGRMQIKNYQATNNGIILFLNREQFNAQVHFIFKTPVILQVRISIPAETKIKQIEQHFRILPDEHFYGFGERVAGYLNNEFDQRGTKVKMRRRGTQGVYVPFFMSTAGYGLWVANSEIGAFDLGKQNAEKLILKYETSQLQYTIFYGPEFPEILNQFTQATGRPILPPQWAFKNWKWRNEIKGDWELYEDARKLRHLDLPAGVTILDRPHFTAALDFRFNPFQYPNPQKLIDDLHRKGWRVILWAVPFVEKQTQLYAEGAAKGYFLKHSDGSYFSGNDCRRPKTPKPKYDVYFVDFTNPAAVEWWKGYLHQILRLGADGFKLDRSDELLAISEDVIYSNGRNARQMYNEYATLYAKVFYEACREIRGDDFVILSRPGFTGAQKYAIFFSGDTDPTWEALRMNLFSMLRTSLSGFPHWSHSVGGYRCKERFGYTPTRECFIRWVQLGCFSPVFDRGGLWFEEPWDYDENTLRIFRYYAKLHTELNPYIYSLAGQAHQSGLPIIRPLVLNCQTDTVTHQIKDEYLFGNSFLVAPIIDRTTSRRTVYLPAGIWRDFWNDDSKITGPQQIEVNPPLHQIPIFIKEGAIIPLAVTDDETGHGAFFSSQALTIDIYPADSSQFQLYDQKKLHKIQCISEKSDIRISFTQATRPIIFRIKANHCPNQVILNRRLALPRVWRLAELPNQNTWFYDAADHRLWIFTNRPGDIQLQIVQQYQFLNWNYPRFLATVQGHIPIKVEIANYKLLNEIDLNYQLNYGPIQKAASQSHQKEHFLFHLPVSPKVEGAFRFFLTAEDSAGQLIYSGVKILQVDSDTSGPQFSAWSFPDSAKSGEWIPVAVKITDPAGVSRSKWAHAPMQIYWTSGDSTGHSYGEKPKNIFKDKNMTRFPKFKNGKFHFNLPPAPLEAAGKLSFYIEAWDYDDSPARAVSETKTIYIKSKISK